MAHSRGFRQGRTTGPRRVRQWGFGPGSCVETSVSGVGSLFVGASVSPTTSLTVVRLRGRLQVQLLTASEVGGGFCGAFGIGLATAAAVAAGTTAVPTPIVEQEWDGWLFWTPVQIIATATDEFTGPSASLNIEVDTKAMRKLEVEDALYAMLEMEVEEGTATGEARFDSRVLALLP